LTTNPGILFSGSGTESKYKTLLLVPEKYRPEGLLVLKSDTIKKTLEGFNKNNLNFPVIAKPDIGFRGYLVKKIDTQEDLINYLNNVDEDIIIQEFVDYKKELGIFYHRMPDNKKGKITSITIKKFISVIGDGKNILAELIRKDERAFLYFDLFKNIHKEKMDIIYNEGKEITLSVIGNHSKGTQFLNGNYLITNHLEHFADQIFGNINGWYYGRLDIKYKSLEKLLQKEDFKILEVNGIISEPTHIYDASSKNASFISALKSINEHWKIMGEIAIINHRDHGIPYPKVLPYLRNLYWLNTYIKKLKKLNKLDF
jgi:D-alanine-D-alanine ligase-like ATP-grasp enzyme